MGTPSISPQVGAATPFADHLITQISRRAATRSWSKAQTAAWLTRAQLAPLVAYYLRGRPEQNDLRRQLQPALHHATALNLLQNELFERLQTAVAAVSLSAVDPADRPILLKGAALSRTVYPTPATRPMGDIDLWVPPAKVTPLIDQLEQNGFRWLPKTAGAQSLKTGRSGEFQLVYPAWQNLLLELHTTPFPGWWLDQTTPLAEQESAIWARAVTLPYSGGLRQLDPADALIHLAVHLAVNHQFSLHPLRSLVDIALLIDQQPPHWPDLIARTAAWRLRPVVWLALTQVQAVWGISLPPGVLAALAPRRGQQRLLKGLVSTRSVWHERDISTSLARFMVLLALIERPADRRRLIRTAMWPEPSDLKGQRKTRWSRLWRLLTAREL